MQIIDVRRAYGIECSEFSYDIDSALSVTEAWDVIDDILNSEIVRRKSNPRIKLPANLDAVAAIEPFALKSTDRIFEVNIGPFADDIAILKRLWGIVNENKGRIKEVLFSVSAEDQNPMWTNSISPGSGFEKVKKRILSDCDELEDMGGVEEFEYLMAIIGEQSFAPVFCDIEFLDTNMSIYYNGVSKKLKKELTSFHFDFEVLFDVDWNIEYQDEYMGLTDVYVDWCSLVLRKSDGDVDLSIVGHTDLCGQEAQIPKAVAKVLNKRTRNK